MKQHTGKLLGVAILIAGIFFLGVYMMAGINTSVSAIAYDAPFTSRETGNAFTIDPITEEKQLRTYELVASKQNVSLREGEQTEMFTYNGQFPGPILRAREGERVRVHFKNRLSEPSTIHWHGMQVENDMDGVPGLTQDPVPPGGNFTYEFQVNQSGTYWYHPHYETDHQIEKGLYGPLIIDEANQSLPIDKDAVLMIDDIRLDDRNRIPEGTSGHDVMHGRMGNVMLINGLSSYAVEINQSSVLRLRLINPSNARTYAFTMEGMPFSVIGHDIGELRQPYTADQVVLAPGQRKDVLVIPDKTGTFPLSVDVGFDTIRLGHINVTKGNSSQSLTLTSLEQLVLNEDLPDWNHLQGQPPNVTVELAPRMGRGNFQWTLNGKSSNIQAEQLSFQEGKQYVMRFENLHGLSHPMHLHGQKFQVIARDGKPVHSRGFLDTVLVRGGETVDIAFIAEGKGVWANHCHILEHAEAGMLLEMHVS